MESLIKDSETYPQSDKGASAARPSDSRSTTSLQKESRTFRFPLRKVIAAGVISGLLMVLFSTLVTVLASEGGTLFKFGQYLILFSIIGVVLSRAVKHMPKGSRIKYGILIGFGISAIAGVLAATGNATLYAIDSSFYDPIFFADPQSNMDFLVADIGTVISTIVFGSLAAFMMLQFFKDYARPSQDLHR